MDMQNSSSSQRPMDQRYSLDQLLETVQRYNSHFGDTVPLDMLAKAATQFRSTELMMHLSDRIVADTAVSDWRAFSDSFFAEAIR